jgi:5'-3' exonuclease
MQPLIDADVLVYEVGFGAEAGWKKEGHVEGVPSFDRVAEMLDNRIANICALVEATHPPILFLTGKGNFREAIATRQKYKERPSNKPWHYYNIKAYIQAKYETRISEGMEADDLMAIYQTEALRKWNSLPEHLRKEWVTIICTRDKDLRAVPGWHFGWELGSQPQFGPECIDEFGSLRLSNDRKSLKGGGLLFFYGQCLTGDPVDTIPGLPDTGPVKAFKILEGSKTPKEALQRVYGAYKAVYGAFAYKELLEQGRLLWMTRKLKPDGSPYLWGQRMD